MYECSQCGSQDIEVQVLFNLKTKQVAMTETIVGGMGGSDCWCNKCEEWTEVKEE